MSKQYYSVMYKDGSGEAQDLVVSPTRPVCSKLVHTDLGHISNGTVNYEHDEKVTPVYLEKVRPHSKKYTEFG